MQVKTIDPETKGDSDPLIEVKTREMKGNNFRKKSLWMLVWKPLTAGGQSSRHKKFNFTFESL